MFEHLTLVSDIDYPKKNPHRAVWIVGSCNGLICIAIDENDMFFWNQSTRTLKKLPPATVKMKQGFYYLWGFGYNESDDDYKVVGIFNVFGNGCVYESVVKVYSLRTNSWKRIEDFKGGIPLDDSGKFASGKLHFPASQGLLDSKWVIVSLDLKSEVYGIVEKPNYGEGPFDSSLGVLGGCIFVLCDYQKTQADLWVLKEYGIKESWTKVVTIPYIDDPGKFLYSHPLCMLPNAMEVKGGPQRLQQDKEMGESPPLILPQLESLHGELARVARERSRRAILLAMTSDAAAYDGWMIDGRGLRSCMKRREVRS
ncbi:hypothetical protein DH2020_014428 [Rehmannia glutinosa]|uniref:F-box associated beta-propeller type 3 domain-containing protein n=1 Tax=Rehmannia glutinosa TaxID=99300 RepID=A0ABR0WWC3_REHGL